MVLSLRPLGRNATIVNRENVQSKATSAGISREANQFVTLRGCRAPLPSAVDQDNVLAEYKQGILKSPCPKTEAAKPKRIEVKS
jgi:HSP20 family molecular chaperone IbpA